MRLMICRAAVLAMLAVTCPAGAHEDDPPPAPLSERLGTVEFEIACNAEAQREFNRAMAHYHSFWFDPASESFRAVARHDPECGMAY